MTNLATQDAWDVLFTVAWWLMGPFITRHFWRRTRLLHGDERALATAFAVLSAICTVISTAIVVTFVAQGNL